MSPTPEFVPPFPPPPFTNSPTIPPSVSTVENKEAVFKSDETAARTAEAMSNKVEAEAKTVEIDKEELRKQQVKIKSEEVNNFLEEAKVKRISGPYNESKLLQIEAILKNTSIDSQQLKKAMDKISHVL